MTLLRCAADIGAWASVHLGPAMQLLDLMEVHVVLVTTPHGLLGLPHLTAHLRAARRHIPRVYCTQAVLDVAQHMAVDMQAAHQAAKDCVVVMRPGRVRVKQQPSQARGTDVRVQQVGGKGLCS